MAREEEAPVAFTQFFFYNMANTKKMVACTFFIVKVYKHISSS
jgi:hypothetical protein